MGSRAYIFTVNNPDGFLTPEQYANCRYCVYQLEMGEKSTPHFQGYIELKKPARIRAVQAGIGAEGGHFEVRRGTREQARAYAMKDDTRLEGPWEYGDWAAGGQGTRTDWQAIKQDAMSGMSIHDMTVRHFSAMVMYGRGVIQASSWMRQGRTERTKVMIFYGPPGSGKTTLASELYPNAYWKPARSKWFDGYNGEDAVVMDEFHGGWFEFDLWKRIGDGSRLLVEVKGGYVQFNAKVVIYISNFHPREWYPNLFREKPDQLKALARRVDLVEVFTSVGVHSEQEDPVNWCLEGEELGFICSKNKDMFQEM